MAVNKIFEISDFVISLIAFVVSSFLFWTVKKFLFVFCGVILIWLFINRKLINVFDDLSKNKIKKNKKINLYIYAATRGLSVGLIIPIYWWGMFDLALSIEKNIVDPQIKKFIMPGLIILLSAQTLQSLLGLKRFKSK